MSSLRQQESLSQFWSPEVQVQGAGRAPPPWRLRGRAPPASSRSWLCGQSLRPLSLSSRGLALSLLSPLLPLLRTPVPSPGPHATLTHHPAGMLRFERRSPATTPASLLSPGPAPLCSPSFPAWKAPTSFALGQGLSGLPLLAWHCLMVPPVWPSLPGRSQQVAE